MNDDAIDKLYAEPIDRIGDFRFDDDVAAVFDDMIRRSVPGYGSILAMIPLLVDRYAAAGTRVYDLGCSLGAGSIAAANVIAATPRRLDRCRVIAVDSSPAMINRLTDRIDPSLPIDVQCRDIMDLPIENASVALCNFTLQFIAPQHRTAVIRRIGDGLRPGGVLLLSEKIHLPTSDQTDLLQTLHHQFKRANGYSDLEISQKRTALENSLVTETLDQHIDRLVDAGFNPIVPWFSCLGFASIVAAKPHKPG